MLTVNDLMTVNPITIEPTTTLRRIIEIMKQEGCRQIPIMDEGQLVGIVTDRDVRLAMNSPMVLHGRWQDEELLDKAMAENVMTPNPLTTTPETPIHQAARMLSTYKFGALPVLDNGTLVGIITVSDLLDHLAASQPDTLVSD
ncbi:MAG: CBS domain-containing protein [Ardenticatenaceae bacterium]|nr:CBS domain-containing protein [Ardenticatenaceae bacterium]